MNSPYSTYYGAKGTGKSTFLKIVKDVLDCNTIATESEHKEVNRLDPSLLAEESQYLVLTFDFGNFDAKDIDAAEKFFKKQFATFCRNNFEFFDNLFKDSYHKYNDFICALKEEYCSVPWIFDQLKNSRCGRRTALLIDNLIAAEQISRQYGYFEDFRKLAQQKLGTYDNLKSYNVCIQVGDIEPTMQNTFGTLYDNYFSYIIHEIHPLKFDYTLSPFIELAAEKSYEIDWNVIDQRKMWIEQSIREEKIRKQQYEESIFQKYRLNFHGINTFGTEFINIRKFDRTYNTNSHKEINTFLRKLYDYVQERNADYTDIYKYMQNVDDGQNTDWTSKDIKPLTEFALKFLRDSDLWNNDDCYWSYFKFKKDKEDCLKYNQIKCILSCKDKRVKSCFEDFVKELLSKGRHSFSAKISKKMRDDMMCFWLYADDFFLLEQRVSKKESFFCKPLKFTPYRGSIAISRDFADPNSYNATIAEIIQQYFKQAKDPKEIDICEIIDYFVHSWNYETKSNDYYKQYFKNANCQTLLVILESINAILEESEIGDNHFLLNGNYKMWEKLCNATCWDDLNRCEE